MIGRDRLRRLLVVVPGMLAEISEEQAGRSSDGKWSAKQELGHLLDSAVNNHQRVVRAALENAPAMPDYDGDRWVALHRYQSRRWNDLITLWHAFNTQLLVAADGLDGSQLQRTCTIGDSGPLTVEFVINDYVRHMVHHLEHIGLHLDVG